MPLDNLNLECPDNAVESLTLALAAVVREGGGTQAYDEVNVALGIPFMFCAERGATDVADWAAIGRDVGLLDAAALLGVQLRPLHPRSAAAGLTQTAEYSLHFDDSYAPLIRRALAHGQPVLAWQGWPEPAAMAWGVLTTVEASTGALRGAVTGIAGTTDLVAPPLQCYVVEKIQPCAPHAEQLLASGTSASCRLAAECAESPTLAAGPAAFNAWIECLEREGFTEQSTGHQRLLDTLIANRASGFRWLRRNFVDERACSPHVVDIIEQLARSLDTLRALRLALPSGSAEQVRRLLSNAADAEAGYAAAVAASAGAEAPNQMA